MSDWLWLSLMVGGGYLLLLAMVWLIYRQLNRVDDLANELHNDLLAAEAKLAELAKRRPISVQTLTTTSRTTQTSGRHARPD